MNSSKLASRVFLLLLFTILCRSSLKAQSGPWIIRFESGLYNVSRNDNIGAFAGINLGKSSTSGLIRFDGNLVAGRGEPDQNFFSLNYGFDIRPFPKSIITPIIGLRIGGTLAENSGAGGQILFGADVNINERNGLRLAILRAGYLGFDYSLLIFGYEYRI